jgi:predicted TPR repeat methyltransferase
VILDLGCGSGLLVHLARQVGYSSISGVDVSAEQVAQAQQLGTESVREGDLISTLHATASDSHDVVVTFDVIEHFSIEELVPLVDEVRRVLKSGGRWIIHCPNADSPFFGRVRYGDITHVEAFTATSIRQLLLSSGFRRVSCYEDRPVVHGVRSASRYALWRVFRAMLQLYLVSESGTTGSRIFSQNLLAVAIK